MRLSVSRVVVVVSVLACGPAFADAVSPGVYVLAGVGYNFAGPGNAVSVDPANNTSIFGNTVNGHAGDGPSYKAGVGYRINPWLRSDVQVGYGQIEYKGEVSNTHVTADVSVLSGLVNGFIDIQGLTMTDLGGFEPYVGAGIGAARTLVTNARADFDFAPGVQNRMPSGVRYNMAYGFYVGSGLRVARFVDSAPRGLVFDFGYAYKNFGDSGSGAGFIENFTNGALTGGFFDPGTKGTARSQSLNFEVRWEF